MENLEEEIINRLNKILSKYSLKIIINDYNLLDIIYYLNDEITDNFICSWESIDDMLFDSSFSLFYRLRLYYTDILYFSHIQPITKRNKIFKRYKRYAAAYNNIKHLENISCLEEIMIKCDLTGI
jgi:hypothetical protein